MRILLDTHTFLWWNADDPRLSTRAKKLLADPDNVLLISVVSAWEIAIKAQRGKLHLPERADTYIPARLAHYGITPMPVTLGHVLDSAFLPSHHRDPFDRLIIAQARVERLPILTNDADFSKYSVEAIW